LNLGEGVATRLHHPVSALSFCTPGLRETPDPTLPFRDTDSLVIEARGAGTVDIEPRFSLAVADAELARLLHQASTFPARVVPGRDGHDGSWRYVQDVVERGYGLATWAWFHAPPDLKHELPIVSVPRGAIHPTLAPDDVRIEGYLYLGAVRPGLIALVGALRRDGFQTLWFSGPGAFGHHVNAGTNGDLPGDVYRIQAGVALLDRDTGRVAHDAYSAALVFAHGPRVASFIVPPGDRPLLRESGREHWIFLASDTHDCLETGERIGLGGMVFPNVPADVTWTVTPPEGDPEIVRGRANRLGIVRGDRSPVATRPGVYRVEARVTYDGLAGGIPGTKGGRYWVAVLDPAQPRLLHVDLPPYRKVSALEEITIGMAWPVELTDVTVNVAVLMAGRVLEEGTIRPTSSRASWQYHVSALDLLAIAPNIDLIDSAGASASFGEVVVFQIALEGRLRGDYVVDGARIVWRGDGLFLFDPSRE
jgi:hypothetical protein